MDEFSRIKKIDAHTHIGVFGSPFNINFDTERLIAQMDTYNIEKTILCAAGPHENEDTVTAFKAHPEKVIPLMWVNCAEGQTAGFVMYRVLPNHKYSWLIGSIAGAIVHIIGYTLVKIPLYGMAVAVGEIFTLTCQSAAGVILGGVAYTVLSRSPAIRSIRAKLV